MRIHRVFAAALCVVILVLPTFAVPPVYTFTPFAGATAIAYADGTGSAARFGAPEGIAIDNTGMIYIADTNGCSIRKMTPAGVVTTWAGIPGVQGSVDGPVATAEFIAPWSLAFDAAGNLIVGDVSDGKLRMISPDGMVSTIASGLSPFGVAFGSDSTLYIAGGGTAIVSKRAPDGTISVVAGQKGSYGNLDGSASAARFEWPTDVAISPSGELFVSDSNGPPIRRISRDGEVSTFCQLRHVDGLCFGKLGYLVATVRGSASVWEISPNGDAGLFAGAANVTTPFGSSFLFSSMYRGYVDGTRDAAEFYLPAKMAFDAQGNLYVSDTVQRQIRRISPSQNVTTIAGAAGGSGWADGIGNAAHLYDPQGIGFDANGNLYVADRGNQVIRRITPAGVVTTIAGSPGRAGYQDGSSASALFSEPCGLTVAADGTIFVADTGNGAIREISPAGVVTTPVGPGFGPSSVLMGVTCADNGTLYVTDSGRHVVWAVAPTGSANVVAGTLDQSGFEDGPVGTGKLYSLNLGILATHDGTIFISDPSNAAVRIIRPDGVMKTLAGGPNVFGADSRLVIQAPAGLALDPTGAVVVASSYGVRKISPDGTISMTDWAPLDPSRNLVGGQDYTCSGVAVDRNGTIFGSLPSQCEIVQVTEAPPARLVNVSIRAYAGSADQTLTAGFCVAGAGDRSVLIRGVGPSLAPLGVTDAMLDPLLNVYSSADTVIATNDNWGGSPSLADAFGQSGAFPLPADSKDAALIASLTPGSYTAQISGSPAGTALIEVYDRSGDDNARLVNVSARGYMNGSTGLTAGFTIAGSRSKQVLIRGIGPTLGLLGVSDAAPAINLEVFDHNSLPVAWKQLWDTTPEMQATFARVGAFGLPAHSKDAVVLLNLSPGSYTATVVGTLGIAGIALIEVYDADP